jgi:hypothetical protein
MVDARGDWPALVETSAATSTLAVELSALGEEELPRLVDFLQGDPSMPFHYVSVHAPSKNLAERARPRRLASSSAWSRMSCTLRGTAHHLRSCRGVRALFGLDQREPARQVAFVGRGTIKSRDVGADDDWPTSAADEQG